MDIQMLENDSQTCTVEKLAHRHTVYIPTIQYEYYLPATISLAVYALAIQVFGWLEYKWM